MIQVSEKRWYWLKVFALATIRDWDALEKFSKEKRPPIGQCSVCLTLKFCYIGFIQLVVRSSLLLYLLIARVTLSPLLLVLFAVTE